MERVEEVCRMALEAESHSFEQRWDFERLPRLLHPRKMNSSVGQIAQELRLSPQQGTERRERWEKQDCWVSEEVTS